MLEYSLIKQHQPRFNIRLARRQELPVPRGDRRRPVAPGHGHAGPASARATATSAPTATPTPSATPSICCCAPSPSAPVRTTSSTVTPSSASPASSSTSRSAPARASARSTNADYDDLVSDLIRFLDGDTDEIVGRARGPDARRRRRPRSSSRPLDCRDRLLSVRKAIEKQQMVGARTEDIDVIGLADDELEAAVQVFYVRKGRVMGRKGFIVDKVEDLDPGELVGPVPRAPVLRREPAGSSEAGTGPELPDGPASCTRSGSAELRGSTVEIRGAPARRQAGARRDGHPERQGGVHPAPAASAAPTTTAASRALNELQEHLGLPEAPLRIECYDMSHIQGTDYVGLHGGPRGRSAEEARVPALQDPHRRRQRRLRRHGGGADAAPHRLPRRAGQADRTSGASSPTRRSCCSSTAARGS